MALHEALHATAFGSDEACPDDDVVKILVDADIFASVIFPYQAALALTKGLKLEQRHQAPSAEILDKFLSVVAAKGFQHEATKALVSTLTRRDIVARQHDKQALPLVSIMRRMYDESVLQRLHFLGYHPSRHADQGREGRCRRHAPTPMSESMDQEAGTIWPATFDDDWCGEGRMHGDEVTDDMLLDLTPAPRPKNKTPPKRDL